MEFLPACRRKCNITHRSATAETVTAADVGAAGAGDTEEEAAVGTSWTPGSVAAR